MVYRHAALVRFVGLGMLLGTMLGCDPDPVPECAATYQHVLRLARRSDDAALMARFVETCGRAFDPGRLACIRAATTAGEALACKPVRKRPS